MLADLHEQLRDLDLAIESLERLQNGNSGRRRGRPTNESPSGKAIRKTGTDSSNGAKRRGRTRAEGSWE